jgi:hypothetical protein
MNFENGIGERAIKEVVQEHPEIGTILARYEIGCVTCGDGICHLKDVVSIHGLPGEVEAKIENEINRYLRSR